MLKQTQPNPLKKDKQMKGWGFLQRTYFWQGYNRVYRWNFWYLFQTEEECTQILDTVRQDDLEDYVYGEVTISYNSLSGRKNEQHFNQLIDQVLINYVKKQKAYLNDRKLRGIPYAGSNS